MSTRFALLLATAVASVATSGSPRAGTAAAADRPCRAAARTAAVRHVVWIWMENKARDEVIGSAQAPFTTALAAGCATAVRYLGVTHPSLPNYLAATSGGTWGIEDDAEPTRHPIAARSFYEQLGNWREYAESAPGRCVLESGGRYAVKHVASTYYTRIRRACRSRTLPLGTTTRGALARDLDADRLPRLAVIVPDLCSDTHDCPVAVGDAWLRRWLGRLTASPAYASGATVVFVVWDESDDVQPLPFVAVAPPIVPGTVVRERVGHYALLRATEDLLGLAPLGRAADPAAGMLLPGLGL